ncbi:MAG: hypothetical protein ACC628_21115 [Pirellulaceae bacterium]
MDDLFVHPQTRPVDLDWIDAYRERRGTISFQRVVEVIEESPEPPPSPHSIQQEALAALKATREAGNKAGLVVLATRRVLFVAHREEILTQAMQTFRRIRPRARLGFYTGKERTWCTARTWLPASKLDCCVRFAVSDARESRSQ